MSVLVKLHRSPSVVPSNMLARATGYPLSKGTLVYTHNTKGQLAAKFMEPGNNTFKVFNDTGTTLPFSVMFGTYEGATKLFDPLDYLHQRKALLGSFGETGNPVADGVLTVSKAIANPGELVAKLALMKGKKYFVAFYLHRGNVTHPRIMHNQLTCISSLMIRDKLLTLGQVYNRFKGEFLEHV